MMGVSKRELLEHYYYDELGAVIEQWNALHRTNEETVENVDPLAFFGSGGEWVR